MRLIIKEQGALGASSNLGFGGGGGGGGAAVWGADEDTTGAMDQFQTEILLLGVG